jgi:DNA-binding SARP family transcriptional activator
MGRLDEARLVMPKPGQLASTQIVEVGLETARMELEFGSTEAAALALPSMDPDAYSRSHQGIHYLLAGEIAFRLGDHDRAAQMLQALSRVGCADAAGKLREAILRTRMSLWGDSSNVAALAAEAVRIAAAQNTPRGQYTAQLLAAMARGDSVDALLLGTADELAYCWSLLAEELAERLDQLSSISRARLEREARSRPERWRVACRNAIAKGSGASAAADLLVEVGDADDASWLRKFAARDKDLRSRAAVLSRRQAVPLWLADLGVVRVTKSGSPKALAIRRKALAVLCFLATRPSMAANRDEVIEAIWPDLGPEAGTNSMHQAIYSLRRVIDPEFKEGLSAAYIEVDDEIVTIRPELVETASARCWRLLGRARVGDLEAFEQVQGLYVGRYALTFTYEPWADAYRETLHAAVLSAAEGMMSRLAVQGDHERAIEVGLWTLAVDPQADAIELQLLKAYKLSGRKAAAAEQYGHYAAMVREELGAEPPSFDDV